MRLLVALETTVVLGFAIGAVCFTLARTKITQPLREKIKARNTWLGNLVGCPYCLSHWFAFGAAGLYRPRIVHLWLPLDVLVAAMVMVAVAAFVWGLIHKAATQ